MNCNEMKELLSCYIDGVLEDKEMKEVESHLEQCPYCRQELAELKASLALVHQGGEVEPPEGFRAGVMEKITVLATEKGSSNSQRNSFAARFNGLSPWIKLGAAAAVMIIGIGIGVLKDYGGANYYDMASPGGAAGDTAVKAPAGVMKEKSRIIASDGVANSVAITDQEMGLAKDSVPVSPEAGEAKSIQRYSIADEATSAKADQTTAAQQKQSKLESQRKIIKNASVRLEVTNVMDTSRRIATKVEALGGFVENSTISAEDPANIYQPERSTTGEVRHSTLTVRVPVNRFEEMFSQLKGMGTVAFENRSGQDVTAQYQDTQTRIRNLKRHEDRLLAILDKAKTLDETLRVENELRRIREEVELQEGEMKRLNDLTDLATLQVELIEVKSGTKITSPEPKTVFQKAVRAFVSSTNFLLDFLSATVVFVGGALPFAAVLAVVGGIGWYFRKLWKK
ncbi:MAG: DUF4349 domain-containing protein [Clostridia bacterium]|nr:DUF4349 domain-containing protein [Clostridia bacterium]